MSDHDELIALKELVRKWIPVMKYWRDYAALRGLFVEEKKLINMIASAKRVVEI